MLRRIGMETEMKEKAVRRLETKNMSKPDPEQTLALVAGYRTPFCKAGTELQGAAAADLAAHVCRELLDRTGIDPASIDEVVFGCAGPDARGSQCRPRRRAARRPQPAHAGGDRDAQLRLGHGGAAGGAAAAARRRWQVFLSAGTESMSNYPLLMGKQLVGSSSGCRRPGTRCSGCGRSPGSGSARWRRGWRSSRA